MSWWGSLELGLKFSIILAGLIAITIAAALTKVAIVKRREAKLLADLEAAKCEAKEDEHTLVKRELDEGDLFGIRALEAGFTGGVHQPGTRPTTPVMGTLKPGLGHMKNASRPGSTTPSRRGSLDVPRGLGRHDNGSQASLKIPAPLGRHDNGSQTSLKLPSRPTPAFSPPGSRSASPAPLRIDSSVIAAPFKGLEWNGSRPSTPRGSHVPVPILTFSSTNNSQTDLSQYHNSIIRSGSPISGPNSDISDSDEDSRLSPRVAKFNYFQHNRMDSSASSNLGTPMSSRSRSPNTSIDSTPRLYGGQQDKGRPILNSGVNDSGIELASR